MKIPVVVRSHNEEGETIHLDPDTRVGVGCEFSDEAIIHPWWPKRELFKEPVWYEAVWERELFVDPPMIVKGGGILFFRRCVGCDFWWGVQKGKRGVRRSRRWVLSKREVRKFKLPVVDEKYRVTRRVRFSLEKLYGTRPGASIVFQREGRWFHATVGEYDLWRGEDRVERNRESKVRKRHNKHMKRTTWLDRILRD